MQFFKLSANRCCLGLSNKLPFNIIGQGAAKLWLVKVGGPKKLPYEMPVYLKEIRLCQGRNFFFRPPSLTGHSFAAPWAMMIKSDLYESPKPYLFAHNLENSIVPLLTSVRTSWKVSIYYINRALSKLNGWALYLSLSKILKKLETMKILPIMEWQLLVIIWLFSTFLSLFWNFITQFCLQTCIFISIGIWSI